VHADASLRVTTRTRSRQIRLVGLVACAVAARSRPAVSSQLIAGSKEERNVDLRCETAFMLKRGGAHSDCVVACTAECEGRALGLAGYICHAISSGECGLRRV
jgi:hypothetical protein